MIYSKTCEYAIRSLTHLATCPRDTWTRVAEVSRQTGVPGPYVSKIFRCLVLSGILRSSRGAWGGFAFQRDPRTVSLMDVIRSIDALEPWNECVMGLDRCRDQSACPVHEIWKRARQKMLGKFKAVNMVNTEKAIGKFRYRELKRCRLNRLMKGA